MSGPPGAGKTTLLASVFASAASSDAAWLSLDQRDNERGRLAALVAAALVAHGCDDGTTAVGAAAGDDLLDAAFGQLSRSPTHRVLMLDDVQELRSRPALATLTRLVTQAPEGLDVVLSSRADPPIRLERLRLDDRLAEVRYADLCFDQHEAAAFFAAHDLTLSEPETRALWERVEGWAAGLRLAACALRSGAEASGFVADTAATEAAVADYLFGEVLVREDDATRDFLLRTSVAERLTPELAIVLTGDPRAGDRLVDLERRGIFLVGLDGHQCYRYHALFRALLQAHLRQRQPQLIEELHRRAARWHLDRRRPLEAEEHARTAGDWRTAGPLLLRRYMAGAIEEPATFVSEPLADIPADRVLVTPELALVAATEACRRANRQDADLYRAALDQIETPRGHQPDRNLWHTARRALDVTFGWTFGADDRSRAAIAALARSTTPEAWTPRMRQLAVLADAETNIDAGDLGAARDSLEDLAAQDQPGWHPLVAAAMLATLDAATGNIRIAEERLTAVRSRQAAGLDHPATARFTHVATALCAAQRGELRVFADAASAANAPADWSPRSLRCVDRALHAAIRSRAPFFVSLDPPTARHPLAQRALVALGVLQVVDATGRPAAVGSDCERALAEARRVLGETSRDERLGPVLQVEGWPYGSPLGHPRTLIEGTVLAAIAADRRGDGATADRRLGDALETSAATGIRAPILDHGGELTPVLDRLIADPDVGATIPAELLDVTEQLHRQTGGTPTEALTYREIAVLQLLPTLMSNSEIARRLSLSVNTVKTHLKAVYRKLEVAGRRDAVLRGRELELL